MALPLFFEHREHIELISANLTEANAEPHFQRRP